MKKLAIIIISIFHLGACSDDDNLAVDVDLLGKWQLMETLADPGDGSGEFMPVISERTIEFFSDSTFISNGSICIMAITADNQSSGTFSIDNLLVDDCATVGFGINYKLEGANLIIYYPCIEGCGHKFTKILD